MSLTAGGQSKAAIHAALQGASRHANGAVALRDVALVYALFESQQAGRPVTIAEVESSAVDAYQREIDEYLGLLPAAK